ncbi:hypothetical protein E3N88_18068 [Mikania micrantha]|uniref:Uncharacterized protein n=1 Tax=Mikania micrantha TaxID=192012 RepID=A0A5N6NTK0_9ASTR|nr:hypothetical protein E3N88_18068 [Mikania micrantha]
MLQVWMVLWGGRVGGLEGAVPSEGGIEGSIGTVVGPGGAVELLVMEGPVWTVILAVDDTVDAGYLEVVV